MGFTSGGPRGVGAVTSDFTPKADITAVLAEVAARGGYLGGATTAARDAISGASLFEGLMIYNTTVDRFEFYDGSGWKAVWQPVAVSARKGAVQSITASTMTNVHSVSLPADAPAGTYQVFAVASTWSGSATAHFKQVRVGGTSTPGTGTVLPGTSDGVSYAAGIDLERSYSDVFTHTGGAVTVWLDVQVNAGSPNANAACSLTVTLLGLS